MNDSPFVTSIFWWDKLEAAVTACISPSSGPTRSCRCPECTRDFFAMALITPRPSMTSVPGPGRPVSM